MFPIRSLVLVFCGLACGCAARSVEPSRAADQAVTLRIGWPFLSGQDSLNGVQQAARLLSLEGLVLTGRDGRPQPRLAERWAESPDGPAWTLQLRRNAVFH